MSRVKTFATVTAIVVSAAIATAFSGTAAQAVTLDIHSDDPVSGVRATINCSACSVLLYSVDGTDSGGYTDANNVGLSTGSGQYGWGSSSYGELFANTFGSNPAAEASWYNSIFGTSITLTDSDKTDPASDGTVYSSSATAVIVKVGRSPNYTILRNDSGGTFTFNWSGAPAGGGGISHFTEVVAPIPVPAAGFLLIGALGGLAGLRRRRKPS